MLEKIESYWSIPLIILSSGQSITLGQVLLVIAILLTGYLASKFVERLIERRLQKTDVTADAAHALKRISFYVRFRIDQLFRDNDIVIAIPQQDVHIKSGLPIDIHTQGSNGNASGRSVG